MKSFAVRKLGLALSLLSLLTSATGCGKKYSPQPSCGFVQNSEGQRVSWKTNGLVKLYYDKSVPASMYGAIEQAINTWQAQIKRKIFVIAGTTDGGSGPQQDGSSIIYWMNTWDPNRIHDEQARTDIYWIGDQLTEADLAFNASGFTITTAGSPGQIDAQSLVLHELGHALGLAHDDDHYSVMNRTLAEGTPRRELQPSDIQSLSCEYNQI